MEPAELQHAVWEARYRASGERSLRETWDRVAGALAAREAAPAAWRRRFRAVLGRFLPGGRIIAGAGSPRPSTLFNCFVMGRIEDSAEGILEALREGALTLRDGGGVGYDVSTVRPLEARGFDGEPGRGALAVLALWDAMCAAMMDRTARRGAMMATLRCDHPDVERFIDAKREPGALTRFNLSVQITDAFMKAVREDALWPLVFPASQLDPRQGGRVVRRPWPGREGEVPCRVLRLVRARAVWDRLRRAAYETAEPGVLFVDEVNRANALRGLETITATNPCGELPLPPYGACCLGSMNLPAFVRAPFTRRASVDLRGLRAAVAVAVRMLDDAIDASHFPLERQAWSARSTRRIGLGVTGLADALIMLGLEYGSAEARRRAAEIARAVRDAAYRASIQLARERGPFPAYDPDRYREGPFVRRLPPSLQAAMAAHGIRNSHLLAMAPAGSISLLAGNVSSGIEPVFAFHHSRRIHLADGSLATVALEDPAHRRFRRAFGARAPLPPAFVEAHDVSPLAHLEMQAALQPFVDSAVSKTINVREDFPFDAFARLFDAAHRLKLKGCTVYRRGAARGAVLSPETGEPGARAACAGGPC